MPFEIVITRTINAPMEFVFDWWTNLLPTDSELVKPLKTRKIISRTPETILIHDEEEMYFKRMSFDVRVSLDRPSKWVSEYKGKDAHARSEYMLTYDGSTTTLAYRTRIEPRGFLTDIFSPLVKPFVKRIFSSEMDVLIRNLENEYKQSIKNS